MGFGAALLCVLLMGYSWTGTQIRMYDDGDATGGHTAGQPHAAAEMAASTDANVAANWTAYTGLTPKYRGLATVLMGSSTGGTNTTTWTDQDAVFDWDNTKTLAMVGTNNFVNWGKKVGSGATATGRNGVVANFGATTTFGLSPATGAIGRPSVYGGAITVRGANNSLTLAGDSASEYIDMIVGCAGTGVGANIRVGGGSATGTLYNVDFWGNGSGGGASILSVFNPTLCNRFTVGGNAMGSEFRLTNQLSVAFRDGIFFGSPTLADISVVGASPTSWDLVRPTWSGGTKFAYSGGTITPGNVREWWAFDVKVVDGSGAPVSDVAITLTDVLGNVQVNATTNSEGRITFGSGITANCVTVLDHFTTAGVYGTRTRSPFLLDVGGGKRRIKFAWPGETTQTYSDVSMPVPWEFAAGGGTTWTEMQM